MKKLVLIGLLVAALLLAILVFTFQSALPDDVLPGDPLLDVCVCEEGNPEARTYYTICTNETAQKTEPFAVSEQELLTVQKRSYHGADQYVEGRRYFCIRMNKSIMLEDSTGQAFPANEAQTDALNALADASEHDVLRIRLWELDGVLYLESMLNVNLWTPYELYRYNIQTQKLTRMYTFANKMVVSIKPHASMEE